VIRYFVLPVSALFVVLVQETILFSMTFDSLRINLTLLLAVYGGFFLEEREGLVLSVILGILLDGLISVIPGVYVFCYVFVFFLARWMSGRVNPARIWPLALFVLLVSFVEFVLLFVLYGMFFEKDLSGEFFRIYLPQAVVAGIICPVVFPIFDRIAGMTNGERERTTYQI